MDLKRRISAVFKGLPGASGKEQPMKSTRLLSVKNLRKDYGRNWGVKG